MEVVKPSKSGGVVSLEVRVSGAVVWQYKYAEDIDVHAGDSISYRNPNVHTLGTPMEIHTRAHSWDFRIANVTEGKQKFNLELRWMQDGVELHKWSESGELDKDKGEIERDDALIVAV